jgi:glycosyltransferase involved in cell wall biosynthesis
MPAELVQGSPQIPLNQSISVITRQHELSRREDVGPDRHSGIDFAQAPGGRSRTIRLRTVRQRFQHMPSGPRVSVVIPCRNQAHFLAAALRSVSAQTERPIETIVVDDGSTDDTPDVATRAGATLLRQQHSGLSATRNRGLRAAVGEYVVFLDADDELEPDALASGVAILQQHPDAWMVGRCCVLTDASGTVLPTHCALPESTDLYQEWLLRNLVWTPGAAMFRREPFVDLGGFPVDVGPAADYAVYLEMARTNRVVFDARPVVRYRQHDANMSRDGARMLRATLAVLRRERSRVPERYRATFREGARAWRTFYGEQIIQGLRLQARAGRFGKEQWKDIALLLEECPALVWTHLTRKLRRVAAGHPPAAVEPGRFTDTTSGSANHPAPVEPAEAPR